MAEQDKANKFMEDENDNTTPGAEENAKDENKDNNEQPTDGQGEGEVYSDGNPSVDDNDETYHTQTSDKIHDGDAAEEHNPNDEPSVDHEDHADNISGDVSSDTDPVHPGTAAAAEEGNRPLPDEGDIDDDDGEDDISVDRNNNNNSINNNNNNTNENNSNNNSNNENENENISSHTTYPIPAKHAPFLHGIAALSGATAILPLRSPCVTLAAASEDDTLNNNTAAAFIDYETDFLVKFHDALTTAAQQHLSSGDETENTKTEEWETLFCATNAVMTAQRRQLESMWNLCDQYVERMLEKLDINPSAHQKGANSQKVMELSRKYGSSMGSSKAGGDKGSKSAKRKRSLGKQATEALNTWFFSHLHDPYPTDEEKQSLANKCGLTLTQINNWFGNKRMRYKRKMLEHARRGDVPQDGSPGPSPVPGGGGATMTPGSSPGAGMFDSPQQPNAFQWHNGNYQ
eukprot:gb/GECH01014013.1/.p1 GENE.gb/GECH01014013.1/~~gb/GECH01014013.1/.p1  ORF type:complete len:459 (+),score=118.98 gb/GECH01014013.1/:1-1377(+)